MTNFSERMQVRVYYEDTDHAGIVYYANYLKFMERGRTEFLRATGLQLDAIEADYSVIFAVSAADIRYHAPARFNDLLEIESSLIRLGGAGLAFNQTVYRGNARLTSATIRLACISRNGNVSRIPEALRNILMKHLNKETL